MSFCFLNKCSPFFFSVKLYPAAQNHFVTVLRLVQQRHGSQPCGCDLLVIIPDLPPSSSHLSRTFFANSIWMPLEFDWWLYCTSPSLNTTLRHPTTSGLKARLPRDLIGWQTEPVMTGDGDMRSGSFNHKGDSSLILYGIYLIKTIQSPSIPQNDSP